MEMNLAVRTLSALSHEGRLSLFRLLVRHLPGDLRPTEMCQALGLKPNTASAYLAALERVGLISSLRRGRSIHYRAEIEAMNGLLGFMTEDCCRGRTSLCALPEAGAWGQQPVAKPSYSVLFLCSGNSARSIIAEALLQGLSGDRFAASSAGTRPSGAVHPGTLAVLARNGLPVNDLRSKSVEDVLQSDGASFDFVFTVCDHAANEECAPWPGLRKDPERGQR